MPTVRLIRLAWREGVGSNPEGAGGWFPDSHQQRKLFELMVQIRCARWGLGSHWIEESAQEVGDRMPDDNEEEPSDTGNELT